MSIFFNAVLLYCIATTHPVSCVDLTLEAETSGTPVVEACIARIRETAIFSYDEDMLHRIAYVETRDGEDPDTYSDPSNNGGIWQLSLAKYEATKVNVSSKLLEDIYKTFQINWTDTTWSDLRIPLYSALAARLYLEVIPDPIPLSITYFNQQANYWADHYTSSGDASSKFSSDVNQLLIKEGTCQADSLDLVFLLDSSLSVTGVNFEVMKDLVIAIVNGYDVQPDRVRVAVMTFSHVVVYYFHLNTHSTKADVITAIRNIPYIPGLTFTDDGLKAVLDHAFTEGNGTRPLSEGVPRALVVMTDGKTDHPDATIEAAMALHQAGVVVFAIGIAEANITELNVLASKPSYVHYVSNFDVTLTNLQIPVRQETCHASSRLFITDVIKTELHPDKFKNVNYPLHNYTTSVKLNSTGSCALYGSTIVTTPNEALYDIKINATGTTVERIFDPKALDTTFDSFYVSIGCIDASNITLEFTIEILLKTIIDPPAESAFYASNVIATCYVNSTLVSTVQWYKPDGSLVISNGSSSTVNDNSFLIQETRDNISINVTRVTSTLTIVNLLESHEGIYTCTGSVSPIDGVVLMESDSFTVTANERISNFTGFVTSPTTIQLSWDVVPGVMTESLVLVCQELEMDQSFYFIPFDKTTLEVLAHPNHTYSCAFPIGDTDSIHKEGNIILFTQPTGPGCVADLNGKLINDTIVQLTWTAPINPNGEITGYRVIYIGHRGTQDGYLHHGPFEEHANVTNVTVSGLRPGYIYEFKVQANNLHGISPENNTVVVLVPPDTEPMMEEQLEQDSVSVPAGPVNIRGEFISNDTVVISWAPPPNDDDIVYYQLFYTGYESQQQITRRSTDRRIDGPYVVVVNSSNGTHRYQATLSSLLADCYYEFKVRGRYNDGEYGDNNTALVMMPPTIEAISTTNCNEESDKDNDEDDDCIIFIILSIIFFVLLLVIIYIQLIFVLYCCCCLKRKKKDEKKRRLIQRKSVDEDPVSSL